MATKTDEVPFLTEYADGYEEPEQPKKTKTLTRTLIPNLVHHVRLENTELICYLCNRDGDLKIEETVVVDGRLCQPKQDLPFICLHPKILNTKPVDPAELLKRTESFLRSFVELPHEQQYLIVSLFIGHTYFTSTHFYVTPLLNVHGCMETGKTRLGELLILTTYRGVGWTSPSGAAMYRTTKFFDPTIVVDELKLWGPDGNKDVAELIKSRYKKGNRVPRVNMNKSGEDSIENYEVYGPFAVCSTEKVPDIIRSRCITIIMQQNVNPTVEERPDFEEAEWIREQWTLLRVKYMGKELPAIENKARRRLREITDPLLQICQITDPTRIDEIEDFIAYMNLIKEEEAGISFEAEIVKTIFEFRNRLSERRFLTNDITEILNKGKPEKECYTDRYVSSCIERIGFEKTRIKNRRNRRGFFYDAELVKRLFQKYSIEDDQETGTVFQESEEEGFFDNTIKPIEV